MNATANIPGNAKPNGASKTAPPADVSNLLALPDRKAAAIVSKDQNCADAQPDTQTDALTDAQNDAAQFDWIGSDSIVLREQYAVAVYENPAGDVVIRQEKAFNDDDDTIIIVSRDNLDRFAHRIATVRDQIAGQQ